MNNNIAETINRINLANKTGLTKILVPNSKIIRSILNILIEENIISHYENNDYKRIIVYLRFVLGIPVFKKIIHYPRFTATTPSNVTVKILKKKFIKKNFVILTTNRGIMSSKQAIIENIGGIVICHVV